MGLVRGAVCHYCLGGCSALIVCARRSRSVRGGWGRCRVSCLPRFPLSTPRFPRCVWRAVPSGCPLSSLAGTPFYAVCAFRGLGPVALLVFPACPLCVCALTLSRCPRPPPLPGSPWRAHPVRSRCWAMVGPFQAVGAPPRVLPRSRAPFGLLWGGGGPVPFPPCLALGRVPFLGHPTARALASWLCALWGRHEGARGGAPLACVWRVWGWALSNPRPLVLWGVRLGPTGPLPMGADGVGMGTRPEPHSAHSCELALCAVGAARGRPGGAPLACVWHVRGRALPQPQPLVLWSVLPGPLPTGCGCGCCGRGEIMGHLEKITEKSLWEVET